MAVSTLPPRQLPPIPPHRRRPRRRVLIGAGVACGLVGLGAILAIWVPGSKNPALANQTAQTSRGSVAQAKPTPVPFDPNVGAILPTHRVVAYSAVPGAPATGP